MLASSSVEIEWCGDLIGEGDWNDEGDLIDEFIVEGMSIMQFSSSRFKLIAPIS